MVPTRLKDFRQPPEKSNYSVIVGCMSPMTQFNERGKVAWDWTNENYTFGCKFKWEFCSNSHFCLLLKVFGIKDTLNINLESHELDCRYGAVG